MFRFRLSGVMYSIVLLWRWTSGNHLDGKTRTDAGWFTRGTKSVATWYPRPGGWALMPRLARSGIRLSATLAALGSVWLWFYSPGWFLAVASLSGAVAAGFLVVAARRGYRAWDHNHNVAIPLSEALSPILDYSPAVIRRDMILEEQRLRFPIPQHYAPSDGRLTELTRVVNQRITGDWQSELQVKRVPFYVVLRRRPEPRDRVELHEVIDAIRKTSMDRPVLGITVGDELVKLDFTGEIAHLAASIGTGGGKSSFLRYLLAQLSFLGVDHFLVCDTKWISLAGMEDVPGIRIKRDVEDIWEALHEEREIMDKRYMELLADPTKVFDKRFIFLEEQNAFALESAIRWRDIRPPGSRALPPVWDDIGLLLLKGRQAGIHLVAVYQRMSAEACGGGSYRDQYGLKLMSRFSPQAWDTLVGTRPRAASSAVQGRAISVMGGIQRNVQIPFVSVEDAMALVREGQSRRKSELFVVGDHPIETTRPGRKSNR